MLPALRTHRFLIARRSKQTLTLLLLIGGASWGWTIVRGNLSAAKVLDAVPLTDPFALLQMLAAGSLASAEAWIGAIVVVLLYGVVAGRAFCSWVCPLNMVTDAAGWIRRRFSISGGLAIPRSTRYLVLGLSLVLSAMLGVAAFEWISPIAMLHRGIVYGMGLGWLAVAAVFLFDLAAAKNGFCGHLCPLGGFYALVSRWRILRVMHDSKRCTQCMKCTAICPEPQVLPMVGKWDGAVMSGECTNCGRCIEVCPDRAMRFGLRTRGTGGKAEKEATS